MCCSNVEFESAVPLDSSEVSRHRTFMDTLGRATLKLSAINLIDSSRDQTITVSYDYPVTAAFRKPVTVFVGVMAVFVAAYVIGKVDISISAKAS